MPETAPKTKVTRSASLSLAEVTVDTITSSATKVGAPTSASVTTGSGNPPVGEGEYLPFSVTYSWSEEV